MPSEPDFRPERRGLNFDATINLGHILTGLMMGAALVTMWANSKVVEANHASRIAASELSIAELRDTTKQIASTQQQMSLTEQKLSLTLEYLAKQPK